MESRVFLKKDRARPNLPVWRRKPPCRRSRRERPTKKRQNLDVNPLTHFIEPAHLVPVLQAIAIGMGVILVTLIVALVVQKVVLERRYRAIEAATRRLASALAGGAGVEDLDVDPGRLVERRALARALQGGAVEVEAGQLRHAAWYPELLRRLQKDARRSAWGERVAAFEMLGALGASEVHPFLEEAARLEDHPQAYGACLGCLARFADQPAVLAALWRQLREKPTLSGSFNEGLFRIAIGALDRRGPPGAAGQAIGQLLEGADPADPVTLSAIWAAGKCGLVALVPRLEALLRQSDSSKSLRIGCVRAIGTLDPGNPLLVDALSDRDWEVQASAARFMREGSQATVTALGACLTSPAFYVRYNAATALAGLGQPGRAALESALGSPDAFAREISRYALRVLEQARA